MDMTHQTIKFARTTLKVRTQAVAEGELAPPSALPPIAQVLSLDARTTATAEALEDRLMVDGGVTMSVLYVCASGRVHGFESVALFKHNVDAPGSRPQMDSSVTATIGDISYRLSTGTLSVRTVVTLDCQANENAEIEALTGLKDAQMQTVRFSVVTDVSAVGEMNLHEDIRLPRTADTLLGVNGYARVQNVSLEPGGAIVEGVLRINLLFSTPDGTLVQAPASMPFSTRMDLNNDATNATARVQISSLAAALSDEDLASVEATILITLRSEVMNEYEVLQDAYSTDQALVCTQTDIPLRSLMHSNCRCTLRQNIAIPQGRLPADRVLITLLRPQVEEAASNKGTLSLSGTLRASIVYLCREGKLHGFETNFPFTCEGEAADLRPGMEVNLDTACELVHAGASGMEISLQVALDIALDAFSYDNVRVVTDVEASEREQRDFGPVVYYPEEGEGLWDIGKRFGVTMNELQALNPDLPPDPSCIVLNLRRSV